MVGKEHKNLLRDICTYISYMKGAELKVEPSYFFTQSAYQNEQNKIMPCYLIARKGCDIIANKMIGQKGTLFMAASSMNEATVMNYTLDRYEVAEMVGKCHSDLLRDIESGERKIASADFFLGSTSLNFGESPNIDQQNGQKHALVILSPEKAVNFSPISSSGREVRRL